MREYAHLRASDRRGWGGKPARSIRTAPKDGCRTDSAGIGARVLRATDTSVAFITRSSPGRRLFYCGYYGLGAQKRPAQHGAPDVRPLKEAGPYRAALRAQRH